MSLNTLPEVKGEYRFDFSLKQSTWFKVGGNAEIFFKPHDLEDLVHFLKHKPKNIDVTLIGNCSNIIVRDGGIDGVTIKLGRNFANIDHEDIILTAGAGALNSSVATYAMHNGLTGLEFLVGIPGTIGGGIRMNAGAYGSEFKDVLTSFTALDDDGDMHEFNSPAHLFKYRENLLDDKFIFAEAKFKTHKDTPENIKARMQQISLTRASSQPIKEKTGGSTFANPEGYRAWELIDAACLRGYKIGDAMFSEQHCNFMINMGNATAQDLESLGENAIKKVFVKSGIKLKWEIKRIGKNA